MKYKYKIIHIPKANGETRPLGVPDCSWRILLHGLNNILLVWLHPYIYPSQHGFIPGRGTLTAWKELSTLLSTPTIYEFDLRKFFDTVNLDYISNFLTLTGVPDHILTKIKHWNQTLPHQSERHGITWSTPLEEANDYKYSKTGHRLHGYSDYSYWINRKRIEETTNPSLKNYEFYRGVSQGMPTSPLLSTIILAPHIIQTNTHTLLYADDGIMTTTEPTLSLPILPSETGISYNLTKSKLVKSGGI
jgi:hypothetical protein